MRGVLAVSGSGSGVETTALETPPSPATSSAVDHRGLPKDNQFSASLTQPSAPSSIEFRNVTFHYRPRTYHSDSSKVAADDADAMGSNSSGIEEGSSGGSGTSISLLKNVSFSILPGENVAIVGPSGSGE